MHPDAFLISAQIINFLLLVWLLNRFLFSPITRVMDERAARVQAELDEARQARSDAGQLRAAAEMQLAALAGEREAVLAETHEQADELKAMLVRTSREQVEQMRTHWQDAVLREREGFLERVHERVLEHAHRAITRALADLADEDLETRVVHVFLDRLDRLDAHEWHDLTAVPARPADRKKHRKKGKTDREKTPEPTKPVLDVTSTRDLPDDVRDRISSAVHRNANGVTVRFHRDERLICGIKLRGPGRKLAWSLDDYLDSLRAAVSDVFDQQIEGRQP